MKLKIKNLFVIFLAVSCFLIHTKTAYSQEKSINQIKTNMTVIQNQEKQTLNEKEWLKQHFPDRDVSGPGAVFSATLKLDNKTVKLYYLNSTNVCEKPGNGNEVCPLRLEINQENKTKILNIDVCGNTDSWRLRKYSNRIEFESCGYTKSIED